MVPHGVLVSVDTQYGYKVQAVLLVGAARPFQLYMMLECILDMWVLPLS